MTTKWVVRGEVMKDLPHLRPPVLSKLILLYTSTLHLSSLTSSPDLQLLPLCHLAVISSQHHRWLEKAGVVGGKTWQIGKFFSTPSPTPQSTTTTSATPTYIPPPTPLKCGNTPGHILSTINKTTSPTFPLRRRKDLRPLPLDVLPLQDYTHGHKYGQPKKNTKP